MGVENPPELNKIDYATRVYFDDVTGIAGTAYPVGTPSVPCNSAANTKAIADALNLRTIHVHGVFTVPDTMEHYSFYGTEHEDIADMLNLNNKDVDGSHISGLIVTGQQAGADFLTLVRCVVNAIVTFQGRMNLCSFWGGVTSTFKNGSYIDLVDCESIYGAVTITVQAPARASIKNWRGNLILTAQDGGICHVRGFKGTLEIDLMTDGTLNVYANGADITINADCIGTGIINIYGNAKVTDNHGAGTTVNDYTLEGRTKGLDDIYDETALIKTETDKIAGSEADAQAAGLDLAAGPTEVFTISTTTRKKVHMLMVSMVNCSAAATITVDLSTKINGVMTQFYSQEFTKDTDPDGIMAINGTLAILADLKVEMTSSDGGDSAVTVPYSYILENME